MLNIKVGDCSYKMNIILTSFSSTSFYSHNQTYDFNTNWKYGAIWWFALWNALNNVLDSSNQWSNFTVPFNTSLTFIYSESAATPLFLMKHKNVTYKQIWLHFVLKRFGNNLNLKLQRISVTFMQ
jgi:hypothetical protein